ncbi:hypothetical protein [Lacticaseibacillus jixiensis]|uniref:hypothetical protein n=1 Tax=Lacticaseibacillus jixiensis TaxID=3231926 RepID=UPI0036F2A806
MKKAEIRLSECRKFVSQGVTEPQSNAEITAADVVDRDALCNWASHAFGTVLMCETFSGHGSDEDLIVVSYF